MILRYATNLKLAKDLYAASKRKLTGATLILNNYLHKILNYRNVQ